MREGHLRGIVASFIVSLVVLLILSGIPGLGSASTASAPGTRAGELTLKVGGQDEMKTRNPLPASANDVWTSDVIYRAFDTVLQGDPNSDQPLAYMAKGVDVNQNGIFEAAEYNQWRKENGTNALDITVYYDFNGVRWHDGTQMDIWDVLFSYHLNAMNGRFNTGLRVLFCTSTASYDSCGRKLNVEIVDLDGNPANGYQRNWQGEAAMPGGQNNALRYALHFTLNEPFALFYTDTLAPVTFPMAEWSRTGGGRHGDFGCAIWLPPAVATARALPECTPTPADPTKWGKGIASTDTVQGSMPYQYTPAELWRMNDADVIGNGPFKFVTWVQGVEAKVVRNEDYFTGVDQATGIVYDPQLARVLQKPNIDGIEYLVYKTTQLGVFALQNAEIDFYHWNVGAEFVPDLLKIPEIAVESNAEPGFFYMSYNMRRAPWGYRNGDPALDDGYVLRQAFSHMVNKKSIVQSLLQNFGVIGHGVISPSNTFWYDDNIPKPDFDLAQAAAILDSPAARLVGIGADPAGACSKDTPAGCRSLGPQGQTYFEILTPQADYDPVRASAGAMIADAMRQVGVNALSRPTAFGEIVNKITAHDFDLFILGWRISGTDPDYLFSFWDSSNAGSGQNYPGFNNQTFDTKIRASRAELDRSTRRSLIFTCEEILADARPYEVLYFRTNIEGYRQDRFVNWTVKSGTIWNFWSIQGIRPPSTKSMREVISVESSTSSNNTVTATVSVFDDQGRALQGASVNVSANGGGTLSLAQPPCVQKLYCLGTSDLNGQVRPTLNAPYVPPTQLQQNVTITADASHPDFPDMAHRTVIVQVFPAGVQFLSILVKLPLGDRVTTGSSLPMQLSVHDQDGLLVGDAQVTIESSLPNRLQPNPDHGTSTQVASVTLSAATGVVTETPVQLTVTATKTAYVDGQTPVGITVAPIGGGYHLCASDGKYHPNGEACPTVATPGLDVLPILAGIGIAAVVAGVAAQRKRRS